MPDPTRPVAAAPIATDWGQAVHDISFTPKGCVASSASTAISSTMTKLPLTIGGPNLSGNAWVCPEAGYYWLHATDVINAAGSGLTAHRVGIYKNGAQLTPAGPWHANTLAGSGTEHALLALLAAGDTIDVYAGTNSGTSGVTAFGYLNAIRIGTSLT